jgi:hypothetical protein
MVQVYGKLSALYIGVIKYTRGINESENVAMSHHLYTLMCTCPSVKLNIKLCILNKNYLNHSKRQKSNFIKQDS